MSRLIIAAIIFLFSLYTLLGIQTKMSMSDTGVPIYMMALMSKIAALVLSLYSVFLNLKDDDPDLWLVLSGIAALLGVWLSGWFNIIAPLVDVIYPAVPYAQ